MTQNISPQSAPKELPKDAEEIIEKHFKDVDDKTIQPGNSNSNTTPYNTEFEEDFAAASKDFWIRQSPEYLKSYEKGEALGLYSGTSAEIGELFRLISLSIEECVKQELETTDHSASGLKDNFYSISVALKILEKELHKLKTTPDMKSICSLLHGFINAYTDSKTPKRKSS
jgi:hypothetical protein